MTDRGYPGLASASLGSAALLSSAGLLSIRIPTYLSRQTYVVFCLQGRLVINRDETAAQGKADEFGLAVEIELLPEI